MATAVPSPSPRKRGAFIQDKRSGSVRERSGRRTLRAGDKEGCGGSSYRSGTSGGPRTLTGVRRCRPGPGVEWSHLREGSQWRRITRTPPRIVSRDFDELKRVVGRRCVRDVLPASTAPQRVVFRELRAVPREGRDDPLVDGLQLGARCRVEDLQVGAEARCPGTAPEGTFTTSGWPTRRSTPSCFARRVVPVVNHALKPRPVRSMTSHNCRSP